jgi:hypothetical protein
MPITWIFSKKFRSPATLYLIELFSLYNIPITIRNCMPSTHKLKQLLKIISNKYNIFKLKKTKGHI